MKRRDLNVSQQTHRLQIQIFFLNCFLWNCVHLCEHLCACACTSIHTHTFKCTTWVTFTVFTPRKEGSLLQPELSVKLLTSGFSPSVICLFIAELWCLSVCVCVCVRARKSLALWNSGAVVLSPTSSGVFLVCVRMPGLLLRVKCGAVRPYGLSPQWPLEAAFVQRDLEREKEGERGPLLSPPTPHTHRLIIFSLYLENPHLKNTFKTVCLLRFLWFIFISGPPV